MSWRSIFISNPAKLRVLNNQLIVQQEEHFSIPLEDISLIVIESSEVTITAALLSELAENKIVLFSCNAKHLPNGVFMPFNSHSRQSKIINTQINLSQPFKNRCWQQIVKQKIINQAECLRILQKEGYNQLLSISSQVQSGDKANREAYAAKLYFKYLFDNFSRQEDNHINHALNYGYSIFRGVIARTLVSYGFMPSLGIHHCSELNNFNLADDFIEVFRPVVDLWVSRYIISEVALTKKSRQELVNLLNYSCYYAGKQHKILRVIDMMVSSFVTSCSNSNHKSLKLPLLLPLELHRYE